MHTCIIEIKLRYKIDYFMGTEFTIVPIYLPAKEAASQYANIPDEVNHLNSFLIIA